MNNFGSTPLFNLPTVDCPPRAPPTSYSFTTNFKDPYTYGYSTPVKTASDSDVSENFYAASDLFNVSDSYFEMPSDDRYLILFRFPLLPWIGDHSSLQKFPGMIITTTEKFTQVWTNIKNMKAFHSKFDFFHLKPEWIYSLTHPNFRSFIHVLGAPDFFLAKLYQAKVYTNKVKLNKCWKCLYGKWST